jgi:hypothetical protein
VIVRRLEGVADDDWITFIRSLVWRVERGPAGGEPPDDWSTPAETSDRDERNVPGGDFDEAVAKARAGVRPELAPDRVDRLRRSPPATIAAPVRQLFASQTPKQPEATGPDSA